MKTQLPQIKFIPYGILLVAILAFAVGFVGYKLLFPFYRGTENSTDKIGQTSDNNKKSQEETSKNNAVAKISFDATESAKLNQNLTAKLSFDTKDKTIAGFDLIINYDPQKWLITDNQLKVNPKSKFEILLNKVDTAKSQIKLSGVMTDSSFSGAIDIASFNLQPIATGELNLDFYFVKKGNESDTNLSSAENGDDLLAKIINAKILVE
ncbi:hypothetical protein GYA19_00625 [Candidatus Beckwithbacteria bacterium]|nr:hypothetical protein [Candidatus Beckwithbacteria bacterium]